jgi:hypothetical protein
MFRLLVTYIVILRSGAGKAVFEYYKIQSCPDKVGNEGFLRDRQGSFVLPTGRDGAQDDKYTRNSKLETFTLIRNS